MSKCEYCERTRLTHSAKLSRMYDQVLIERKSVSWLKLKVTGLKGMLEEVTLELSQLKYKTGHIIQYRGELEKKHKKRMALLSAKFRKTIDGVEHLDNNTQIKYKKLNDKYKSLQSDYSMLQDDYDELKNREVSQ